MRFFGPICATKSSGLKHATVFEITKRAQVVRTNFPVENMFVTRDIVPWKVLYISIFSCRSWRTYRKNGNLFSLLKNCQSGIPQRIPDKQSVHKVFDLFENLVEKSILFHSAVSVRILIKVLRKFYLHIILLHMSAVYSYNVVNSGINIFAPFF